MQQSDVQPINATPVEQKQTLSITLSKLLLQLRAFIALFLFFIGSNNNV